MFSRLDFGWRLLGTGWAFLVFFVGGFLLAGVIFPMVSIFTSADHRSDRYRGLVQHSFSVFIAMLRMLRVIDVFVDQPEALRGSRGSIVIANHPTLIDVVLLGALIPHAQCIVKRALWESPFLGRLVRGCEYIPSDLEADSMMAACRRSLQNGRSVIVFPEGTRSRPGIPLKFRRGFAHIATLLDADIQLMTITCNPPMLAKGERWWAIPKSRPAFHVSPAGVLAARGWRGEDPRPLIVRRIVRTLERFYNERLAIGRS